MTQGLIDNLSRLSFGQDVAEHDEGLDYYFLRTGAFWSVVQDDRDVILGAKGTGKSAIARYLCSPGADIAEIQDVIILPAFNIRGSVLFKRLCDPNTAADEDTYRDIFLAYMVGLAANYVVRTFADVVDVRELTKSLQSTGLHVEDPTVHGVWKKVLSRFAPRLTGRVEIGSDGTPSLSAEADFGDSNSIANQAEPVSIDLAALEVVLELLYESLERLELRCWILFDRLDEAFPDDRGIERDALRGLMRAHLDACSYGRRFRSKLFLRLDVFDRITERAGFVNASHLRSMRITWDSDSILHVVALRLTEGGDLAMDGVPESSSTVAKFDVSTPAGRRAICRRVMPRRIDRIDSLVWLLLVTVDATREFNPRNVITLLRSARVEAIQIARRDQGASTSADIRMPDRAMMLGYKQLSIARLQDTVFAESPRSRPAIERLRGRRTRHSRDSLRDALKVPDDDLDNVLNELRYVGFLRLDGDEYIIPALYRPAVFVAVHGAELRLGSLDASDVEPQRTTEDSEIAHAEGDSPNPPDSALVNSPSRPRRRRRGRKAGRGRDELVPSGAPSEIVDEADFAGVLSRELGGADVSTDLTRPTADLPSSDIASKRSVDTISANREITRYKPGPGAIVVAARELGLQGDSVSAFHMIYPELIIHDGAAAVAADLAFRSEDPDLIDLILPVLRESARSKSPAIQGRRLGFAIAAGNSDEALQVAKAVNASSLQEIAIALVRMIGQLPRREATFWRNAIGQIGLPESPGSILKSKISILAASRCLAICRESWERERVYDPGLLGQTRDQIWTEERWSKSVRHVEGFLWAYGRDPSSAKPLLLPYQALSIYMLMEEARRTGADLRSVIIDQLGRQLSSADEVNQSRFLEWAQFCPLVLEVEFPRRSGPEAKDSRPAARQRAVDPKRIAELVPVIDELLITAEADGDQFILLSVVGARLRRVVPSFDQANYGFASLLDLMQAISAADGSSFVILRRSDGHPYIVRMARPA